jgi:hypothetical protein
MPVMQGADKMNDNEHLLNVYVSKNATGSCAEFLGYTTVTSPADVADRRITPGKWLVRCYYTKFCSLEFSGQTPFVV